MNQEFVGINDTNSTNGISGRNSANNAKRCSRENVPAQFSCKPKKYCRRPINLNLSCCLLFMFRSSSAWLPTQLYAINLKCTYHHVCRTSCTLNWRADHSLKVHSSLLISQKATVFYHLNSRWIAFPIYHHGHRRRRDRLDSCLAIAPPPNINPQHRHSNALQTTCMPLSAIIRRCAWSLHNHSSSNVVPHWPLVIALWQSETTTLPIGCSSSDESVLLRIVACRMPPPNLSLKWSVILINFTTHGSVVLVLSGQQSWHQIHTTASIGGLTALLVLLCAYLLIFGEDGLPRRDRTPWGGWGSPQNKWQMRLLGSRSSFAVWPRLWL